MLCTLDAACEILNALIQKGLRPRRDPACRRRTGNTECPDSKGIKTPCLFSLRRPLEILNALIQKGLRPNVAVHQVTSGEILNALIQKGLRPIVDGERVNECRNTECPDSKGIKTAMLV